MTHSGVDGRHRWDDGRFGIPIFTLEDLWANTNPIVSAQVEMGIELAAMTSGKVFPSPGLGTLDENEALLFAQERALHYNSSRQDPSLLSRGIFSPTG